MFTNSILVLVRVRHNRAICFQTFNSGIVWFEVHHHAGRQADRQWLSDRPKEIESEKRTNEKELTKPQTTLNVNVLAFQKFSNPNKHHSFIWGSYFMHEKYSVCNESANAFSTSLCNYFSWTFWVWCFDDEWIQHAFNRQRQIYILPTISEHKNGYGYG